MTDFTYTDGVVAAAASGESSLSLAWSDLKSEVGHFLGYGRTVGDWTSAQATEVEGIVQSGVRLVYYPPAISPEIVGYEWSWLRPTKTLDIVSGTDDYDLPDDFGRLFGELHYPTDDHRASITLVSVGRLLALRASNSLTGVPRYAAIRYKLSTGAGGQRQEILFYPEPDDDWTLKYEFEAYSGKLTDAAPYLLGGMQLAELYTESCLAVAESRINDTPEHHNEQYKLLLVDAISRDRKRGAKNYGQMGDADVTDGAEWRRGRTKYDGAYSITYKGVQI